MKTFTILLYVAGKIATMLKIEAFDLIDAKEIATDLFGNLNNIKIL